LTCDDGTVDMSSQASARLADMTLIIDIAGSIESFIVCCMYTDGLALAMELRIDV
jgi:hypothetical protein